MNIHELENKAIDIRKLVFDISLKAGSGHFGGSLSAVEILTVLYNRIMNYDVKNIKWNERDRFILSKGHALLALAATLLDAGFFTEELIENYNGLDSAFGMHPNMHYIPGIDMSTGSLGHGLSVGVGMALTAKLDKADWRTFVLLGDGETDEGMVWEAAMSAGHFKLDNLIAIVDRNGYCLDGCTEDIMTLEPYVDKWKAFGWNVVEADGHNIQQLVDAFDASTKCSNKKPSLIIAHTVKGKGADFMENQTNWHYGGLDTETVKKIKVQLESQRR